MSPPPLVNKIPLTVRCHCREVSFKLEIPEDRFPLKSAICHCRSCRHATGQIVATFAVIPTELPSEIRGNGSSSLMTYRSSPTLLRLCCHHCGASIANIDSAHEEEWELATGCMEFSGDPLGHQGKLNRVQLWLEDVKGDGGVSGWINGGKLAGMDRHWRGRDSQVVSDASIEDILARGSREQQSRPPRGNQYSQRHDKLDVRCHCGTISFDICRPAEQHNHASGKLEAGLDVCTSCRLVTGFEITSWAGVPHEMINTTAPDFNAYLADRSKLKHYKSSVDVSRYFCATCGATIFYQKHGLPTIDIGIGVLDPVTSEEARVEDWLLWQKHPKGLGYPEDAVDRKLVKGLADGLRLHKGEVAEQE